LRNDSFFNKLFNSNKKINMSLFSLPIGPAAPSHGVSGQFYAKVEPNQPIRQDNGFGSQRIQFQLNPAANQWFLPSRSYFRVRVNLQVRNGDNTGYVGIGSAVGGGANQAAYALYPAFGMGGKLFSQSAFQVGSTTVCSIASNLPQVDAMHKRTTMSRSQLTQSDGLYQADRDDRKSQFTRGQTTTTSYELIWSPPLGISDVQHGLPASQYLYTFVANPNFARDAVDGNDAAERVPDIGAPTAAGYTMTVESMVFYAAYVQGRDGSDEKYSLNLRQISCQALGMTANSNALQLRNFDTSQDTSALAIAFQDSAEGNRYGGKSVFTIGGVANGDQKSLLRWYVSYDNAVYPQEQNEDQVTADNNWITQRWRDSSSQTGMYFSPGGTELLDSWLTQSGPYYYMNWPRTQGTATRVQLNAELSSAIQFDALLFTIADQSFLVRSQDAKVKKIELAE
jgi:hypothetical protein